MVNVQTEILIHSPIEKVASYAMNPDNAPEWYENIKSAEWRTDKPLVIGSKVAFIAHFLGRKLAYTYEFIELIPNQKLIMRTAEGPFPMETTYTFRKVDEDKTLMMLQNKGEPNGFSKLMAPFMQMMMRMANNKDLKCIKHIMETR